MTTVHIADHRLNAFLDPTGQTVLAFEAGPPSPGAIMSRRLGTSLGSLTIDAERLALDAPALLTFAHWIIFESGLRSPATIRRRVWSLFAGDIWASEMIRAITRIDAGKPAPHGEAAYVQAQVARQLLSPSTFKDGGQDGGTARA